MDPTNFGLFRLAERRLAWLDRRQTLLAENVANVDTPGYTPRDLAPFAASLAEATGTLRRSSPRQFAGVSSAVQGIEVRPQARAPDGNAVSLDTQLKDIADTATDQQLVTAIYMKYLAMARLTLGHGNG
ncbi:MAG: flagellar biosynthesis protein FlgB [Rhodospirillales bacterium]|nr:flagellar biosynthesis protein FlgB [Rhodospirillales bacterium]